VQRSSVVLNRSVLLRRLGPSFSPEAGAAFLSAKGVCAQLRKCARKREFHHAKVSLL
jgi:hypothetical protein